MQDPQIPDNVREILKNRYELCILVVANISSLANSDSQSSVLDYAEKVLKELNKRTSCDAVSYIISALAMEGQAAVDCLTFIHTLWYIVIGLIPSPSPAGMVALVELTVKIILHLGLPLRQDNSPGKTSAKQSEIIVKLLSKQTDLIKKGMQQKAVASEE
jgi:hypothetical protein